MAGRDRRPAIYLDSGIFIAFLDRTDAHHEVARGLFGDPPARWCTSLAVVSETYGWFLHRLGEPEARSFRALIDALPGLELIALDRAAHEAVLRKLEHHRGRKLTYVDAAGLVILQRRRIRDVWGTDQDLAIEGARVHPGGR